jgi:hypothetical protein
MNVARANFKYGHAAAVVAVTRCHHAVAFVFNADEPLTRSQPTNRPPVDAPTPPAGPTSPLRRKMRLARTIARTLPAWSYTLARFNHDAQQPIYPRHFASLGARQQCQRVHDGRGR